MSTDEGNYHALPQTRGRNAHQKIDEKKTTTQTDVIESLAVISHEMGIYGKIDIYKKSTKSLIERKYNLKNIFRGQIYQLWGQYFCMTEMGYDVKSIAFYEISTHKTTDINIPDERDKNEFLNFLTSFRNYNPKSNFSQNQKKCAHCIYCNLCDKTNQDNVYT